MIDTLKWWTVHLSALDGGAGVPVAEYKGHTGEWSGFGAGRLDPGEVAAYLAARGEGDLHDAPAGPADPYTRIGPARYDYHKALLAYQALRETKAGRSLMETQDADKPRPDAIALNAAYQAVSGRVEEGVRRRGRGGRREVRRLGAHGPRHGGQPRRHKAPRRDIPGGTRRLHRVGRAPGQPHPGHRRGPRRLGARVRGPAPQRPGRRAGPRRNHGTRRRPAGRQPSDRPVRAGPGRRDEPAARPRRARRRQPGRTADQKAAEPRSYRLTRQWPDGTVRESSTAFTSLRAAAQAVAYTLADNGAASRKDAAAFASRLQDAAPGTTMTHPSGYSFTIRLVAAVAPLRNMDLAAELDRMPGTVFARWLSMGATPPAAGDLDYQRPGAGSWATVSEDGIEITVSGPDVTRHGLVTWPQAASWIDKGVTPARLGIVVTATRLGAFVEQHRDQLAAAGTCDPGAVAAELAQIRATAIAAIVEAARRSRGTAVPVPPALPGDPAWHTAVPVTRPGSRPRQGGEQGPGTAARAALGGPRAAAAHPAGGPGRDPAGRSAWRTWPAPWATRPAMRAWISDQARRTPSGSYDDSGRTWRGHGPDGLTADRHGDDRAPHVIAVGAHPRLGGTRPHRRAARGAARRRRRPQRPHAPRDRRRDQPGHHGRAVRRRKGPGRPSAARSRRRRMGRDPGRAAALARRLRPRPLRRPRHQPRPGQPVRARRRAGQRGRGQCRPGTPARRAARQPCPRPGGTRGTSAGNRRTGRSGAAGTGRQGTAPERSRRHHRARYAGTRATAPRRRRRPPGSGTKRPPTPAGRRRPRTARPSRRPSR